MPKFAQLIDNEKVMFHFNFAMEQLREECCNCHRLRSCTAWVYETTDYYLLRSYNTFVAVIDKHSELCYDALRRVYGYTSTSNQHISKFWHDYGDTKTQRITYR